MKFELVVGEEKHSDKSFDKEMLAAVLSTAISMREKASVENIRHVQAKRQCDYNLSHQVPINI